MCIDLELVLWRGKLLSSCQVPYFFKFFWATQYLYLFWISYFCLFPCTTYPPCLSGFSNSWIYFVLLHVWACRSQVAALESFMMFFLILWVIKTKSISHFRIPSVSLLCEWLGALGPSGTKYSSVFSILQLLPAYSNEIILLDFLCQFVGVLRL